MITSIGPVEGSAVKRSSRDAIVAATIRLFSERGYPSTSMRDIANEVGLLPGSLYVHIAGKEQLLADIVESGIDRFLTASRTAIDMEPTAAGRLRALIHVFLRLIAEDAAHVRVSLHQWRYLTGDRRDHVMDKRREYEGLVKTLVNDGIASGEFNEALNPRIAVLTVMGALNWTSEWFHVDGPESPDQVADEIADVLLAGLED